MIEQVHSREAETAVVGALLASGGEDWDAVDAILSPSDFHDPIMRMMYEAIQKLVETAQGVDMVTVVETLPEEDYLLSGGLRGAMETIDATPVVGNVKTYAKVVRDHAVRRGLQMAGHAISQIATGSDEPDDMLSKAESVLYQVTTGEASNDGPSNITQLLSKTMDHISELCDSSGGITGYATGFSEVDMATNGLKPQQLIIVAGRPAMGKSAFMMNMAENVLLEYDEPVVVFSMEMSETELMVRMLSGLARVDNTHIQSGRLTQSELEKLAAANAVLHDKQLFIDDSGGMTPGTMRTRCRRIARKHGKLGMIVVDYLQLMGSGKQHKDGNRVQEVSEISRQLKMLAKEFDCPVVAGSQLNRGLESRDNKRPMMSDLRESGAIEQDADIIVGMYRDEVYNENTSAKGLAEAIILKQRNGPIGSHSLAFLGPYTRFEDCVPQPVASHYGSYENEYEGEYGGEF